MPKYLVGVKAERVGSHEPVSSRRSRRRTRSKIGRYRMRMRILTDVKLVYRIGNGHRSTGLTEYKRLVPIR